MSFLRVYRRRRISPLREIGLCNEFFRFLLYVIPWEYLTNVRLLPNCVQLPVFVTSQDFKTSIRFTMDGDSPNKIFPPAIVSTYHAFLLQVAACALQWRRIRYYMLSG